MNYVGDKLTGRTKTTLARQLNVLYIRAHNNQDERTADRLHELYQDVLFDNYLSVPQIKARFERIVA